MKRTNSLRNKRSTAFVFTQEGAKAMEEVKAKEERLKFLEKYEIIYRAPIFNFSSDEAQS